MGYPTLITIPPIERYHCPRSNQIYSGEVLIKDHVVLKDQDLISLFLFNLKYTAMGGEHMQVILW
jgi:hypothetical protein